MSKRKPRYFIPSTARANKKTTYQILFDPELNNEIDDQGRRTHGYTDAIKKIIVINSMLSKKLQYQAFIHEYMHMRDYENPPRGKKKDFHFKHKDIYRFEKFTFEFLIEMGLI